MRILTLNAHKGVTPVRRRPVLRHLREAVRTVDADVVFVQEAVGPDADLPNTLSQCAFLADGVWADVAFGVNAPNRLGPIGNGLLSRFPITSCDNVEISDARGERRGALHCVLEIPHLGPVHVASVHLGLLGVLRRAQARHLWSYLDAHAPADAPLVVAGDFNDWSLALDRDARRHRRTRDAFAALHGRPARTFPARWPLLRLDRVYLRQLVPVHARALRERPWSCLSDHAPLLVEVRTPDAVA